MRLGVLGGTFNPVHAGHVRLALEVGEALGLDGVEMIPSARPPHKQGEGVLPFELRAALVELAVEGLPGVSVNRMEASRPGPSYTWDTLTELRRSSPGDSFYFIMGASDLMNLHLWNRGERLGELANLAVATRDSLGRAEVEDYLSRHGEMRCSPDGGGCWRMPSGNELRLVDVPRLDISASSVRKRFLARRSLRCLVPLPVERELELRRAELNRTWA
ncbi:nicotinate (nicotinamide) nucleotide adenylyltransferase [Fundidesulfovibrio soli]|uniref:nicotinate (nicotinamide) nucleotide adenylyltransferase n=1 Tax=Fundidesulfovibrio soli TaxID=2922716 RepID=UPI001FAED241|nr:nicotinate (nicotinamide) nucleotide adenylyltransferase [Fundidesulfovibrio soli]